ETDAECTLIAWWHLLTIDKDFLPGWREREFPGGFSHACELETSLYMHLAGDHVRKNKIKNHISTLNDGNPYIWTDLLAKGPAALVSWTSTYSPRGVMGQPELATPEKGEQVYQEAVRQLSDIVDFFRERPRDTRARHQAQQPSMPIPWGQYDLRD
ncbi:MAG: creatininase family protein, partial [Pirellulaceae bacterium]|nr:creatininase family protein [Pirellulaceae bacterium]